MNKAFGFSFLSLALSIPVFAQQQTITCASQNGQQQVCQANTRDGVLLVREQSNNICRQGSTWTYDRQGIQVSGGCMADFLVNNRGSRNGAGYGNSGYNNSGQNSGYNNPSSNGNYGNGSTGSRLNAASTLPQGTQLTVRMDQTVRLNELNQGDIIPGTLTNDVSVGGQVIAPAGSHVQAKVVSAQGAPLDLRLDSMTANGLTYTLQSNSVRGIRDAVSTDSNGRGGIGGVLGSLATAGQITNGTVFNFRLTAAARSSNTN